MGDLSTAAHIPFTSAILLNMALGCFGKKGTEHYQYLVNIAIGSGIVAGVVGILGELKDMYDPLAGVNCGNPVYACRGDWGDVLSFSVPIIAGIVFLALKRFRSSTREL